LSWGDKLRLAFEQPLHVPRRKAMARRQASTLSPRCPRLSRHLADPAHADRTVSAMALEAGFGDMSYFNRRFRLCVISCCFEFSSITRLDLVAQGCALTVRYRRMPGRRSPAQLIARFDRHGAEACRFKLCADQVNVMIAMGR
jgi:hypothetical protein